jgi:hypothetical protein
VLFTRDTCILTTRRYGVSDPTILAYGRYGVKIQEIQEFRKFRNSENSGIQEIQEFRKFRKFWENVTHNNTTDNATY